MSSSKRCSQSCDMLSEDLICEILVRLPVESLLRFKTVSKLWHCLISSPDFVKSHCTRPGTYAGNKLIIHDYCRWFSLLQLGPNALMNNLEFPNSDCESNESRIVGSDRGIVCFTVCRDSGCSPFHMAYSSRSCTYLWNPATMHYKLIPPNFRPCDKDTSGNVGLGFGFDPIDNDFKAIRVVSSPFPSEVYSANLNAWRKLGPTSTYTHYPGDFIGCISGLLCWTGYRILTFDLNKEVFTCVTKPLSESPHISHITDFNDSIAGIMTNGSDGKIHLWTLDDVECLRIGGSVEASWTLMLSIETDVPVHSIHSYFNSGDILLRSDTCEWLSYNSVEKVAKKVSNSICWGEIFKYTESLTSVPGFEQLKENVHQNDK